MAKYAFIVSACCKYLPELTALLNSLDYVGSTADVHLVGVHLDKEFIDQLSKLNYKVIHHEVSEEEIQKSRGISEITCRKRYWYAAELGQNYDTHTAS